MMEYKWNKKLGRDSAGKTTTWTRGKAGRQVAIYEDDVPKRLGGRKGYYVMAFSSPRNDKPLTVRHFFNQKEANDHAKKLRSLKSWRVLKGRKR
jgi:hypothetical protein